MAGIIDKEQDPKKPKRKPRQRDKTFTGAFTDLWVKHTKAMPQEVQYAEHRKKGLSLMLYVSPAPYGRKTWRVLYYKNGKPRGESLGTYPDLRTQAAREKADAFDTKMANAAADSGTFKKVAEDWIEDHVDRQRLRSKREIVRHLKVYVYPEWENTKIFDIDRDDVSKLLRSIAKNNGPPQADAVLATIRGVMKWYLTNGPKAYDQKYPLRPGMKRDKRRAKLKRRKRVLTDDEIRALWSTCEGLNGEKINVFGAMVRMLLLTAQRREKVAGMRWDDISEDGVWTICSEENEKGHAGVIKLPEMALDLIFDDHYPRIEDNPYVFPASGSRTEHFNSFSQRKRELDRKLPEHMRAGEGAWRLHDLRRTAKTRMSKIKVDRLHSELVLGHTLEAVEGTAVEGTYDLYEFTEEKSAALQKLADHIALILNPPDKTNVVRLRKR